MLLCWHDRLFDDHPEMDQTAHWISIQAGWLYERPWMMVLLLSARPCCVFLMVLLSARPCCCCVHLGSLSLPCSSWQLLLCRGLCCLHVLSLSSPFSCRWSLFGGLCCLRCLHVLSLSLPCFSWQLLLSWGCHPQHPRVMLCLHVELQQTDAVRCLVYLCLPTAADLPVLHQLQQ